MLTVWEVLAHDFGQVERHRMVVPVCSRTGEEQAGMNKSPPLKGILQPPTKPPPNKDSRTFQGCLLVGQTYSPLAF